MKNLDSVFAAYVIGWGIFFVFYLTIASELPICVPESNA